MISSLEASNAPVSACCSSTGERGVRASDFVAIKRTSGANAIPGAAGRPSMRWAVRRVLWSIQKILIYQCHQRIQRCLRVLALRAKIDGGVLWRLCRHDLDDALGVDPGSVRREAEIDLRFECLGKLGELDRRPGVQPDLMPHKNRCAKLVHFVLP